MEGRIGFGTRLGAALIDFAVQVIVGGILGSILGGVLGLGAGAAIGSAAGGPNDTGAGAAIGGLAGAMAGFLFGYGLLNVVWIIWEGLTGAALGKMILRIRIKSADGQMAPTSQLLTRAAVKYSPGLLNLLAMVTDIGAFAKLASLAGFAIFIGCFFVLGDAKQALHDMAAKTAVYPSRP